MTAVDRHGAVAATLLTLFPRGVAVASVRISEAREDDLWPEERAAVAGAVPSRRAEFCAGRAAARRCLSALGQPAAALPMDKDRAAVWPRGIGGSISHAYGLAVAVAREGGPLGIDIEEDAALEPELWPVICTSEELNALPASGRGRWVRHVFSAKEAVFKAQDPARRALFGFDALALQLTDGGFVGRFLAPVGGFRAGQMIEGRLAVSQGLVMAGVVG